MRFDETSGLSALELIDRSSERELAGILATFGEERRAGRIAKAILAARAEGRIVTAADLAAVVAAAAPRAGRRRRRAHPPGHAHLPGAAHRREPRDRGALRRRWPARSRPCDLAGAWPSSATTASRIASSSGSSRARAATASRTRFRPSVDRLLGRMNMAGTDRCATLVSWLLAHDYCERCGSVSQPPLSISLCSTEETIPPSRPAFPEAWSERRSRMAVGHRVSGA